MVEENPQRVPIIMLLIDGLSDYHIKWQSQDESAQTTL